MNFGLERRTLHFAKPAATSRGMLAERTLWIVRAWEPDDAMVCGLGECGPIPGLSRDDLVDFEFRALDLIHDLSRSSLSLPALASLEDVTVALTPFEDLLRPLPSLRFGIETALLDLTHGGKGLLWDSPFTRGEAALPTHGLIWMDTSDGILRQVEAKVAAGFTVIKMKVAALTWSEEIALLAAIRKRHPHIGLRLDANGAFAPETAGERLEQLAAFNIQFLEQPLRPGLVGETERLCRASPVPLALDEELIGACSRSEAFALLETIRPAHVILKPALLGGFNACHAWIEICQQLGIGWWINSLLESSVGHNAICQWAGSIGEGRTHGLGTGSLFVDNFDSQIGLNGAHLRFNSGPIAH